MHVCGSTLVIRGHDRPHGNSFAASPAHRTPQSHEGAGDPRRARRIRQASLKAQRRNLDPRNGRSASAASGVCCQHSAVRHWARSGRKIGMGQGSGRSEDGLEGWPAWTGVSPAAGSKSINLRKFPQLGRRGVTAGMTIRRGSLAPDFAPWIQAATDGVKLLYYGRSASITASLSLSSLYQQGSSLRGIAMWSSIPPRGCRRSSKPQRLRPFTSTLTLEKERLWGCS